MKNLYNYSLYQIRNFGFNLDDNQFVQRTDKTVQQERKARKLEREKILALATQTVESSQLIDSIQVSSHPSTQASPHPSIEKLSFQNQTFWLGSTTTKAQKKQKDGTLKEVSQTKKRYAFEVTELAQAIKHSPEWRTKTHSEYDGRAINTKILKQTLRQVHQDFSNFFASMKAYGQNPSSFLGRPKLPGYKTPGPKGRTVCTIPFEALSVAPKKALKVNQKDLESQTSPKTNLLHLSMTKISLETQLAKSQILEIKIVPCTSGYDILISYLPLELSKLSRKQSKDEHGDKVSSEYQTHKQQQKQLKKQNKSNTNEAKIKEVLDDCEQYNQAKIKEQENAQVTQQCNPSLIRKQLLLITCDPGLNNLMTLTTNHPGITPIVINGRHLKSINQYFNKELALAKSKLSRQFGEKRFSSNKIRKLTQKRNHKIHTEMHKASKTVVDWILDIQDQGLADGVEYQIVFVMGKNKNWKNEIDLGRKTNQNFVQIPFAKLNAQLEYKLKKAGVLYLEQEESYTSKCSFLDWESLTSHQIQIVDNYGNLVILQTYQGKRVKRGLFRSKNGVCINADVNGSFNIGRKACGKEAGKVYRKVLEHPVEALAVKPVRVVLRTNK